MAMYVYSLPVLSTLLFHGRKGEEEGQDGQIITKNTHALLISDKKSACIPHLCVCQVCRVTIYATAEVKVHLILMWLVLPLDQKLMKKLESQ